MSAAIIIKRCLVHLHCDVSVGYTSALVHASGAAKKREKKRRLDNAVADTSNIRSFCVTTAAGEDETSEGNPENSKRDAVDVAPSVPAPEDEEAAELAQKTKQRRNQQRPNQQRRSQLDVDR